MSHDKSTCNQLDCFNCIIRIRIAHGPMCDVPQCISQNDSVGLPGLACALVHISEISIIDHTRIICFLHIHNIVATMSATMSAIRTFSSVSVRKTTQVFLYFASIVSKCFDVSVSILLVHGLYATRVETMAFARSMI